MEITSQIGIMISLKVFIFDQDAQGAGDVQGHLRPHPLQGGQPRRGRRNGSRHPGMIFSAMSGSDSDLDACTYDIGITVRILPLPP